MGPITFKDFCVIFVFSVIFVLITSAFDAALIKMNLLKSNQVTECASCLSGTRRLSLAHSLPYNNQVNTKTP
jgi:hypothetical protein